MAKQAAAPVERMAGSKPHKGRQLALEIVTFLLFLALNYAINKLLGLVPYSIGVIPALLWHGVIALALSAASSPLIVTASYSFRSFPMSFPVIFT